MAKNKEAFLKVTLVKSPIGSNKKQLATIEALGLKKMSSVCEHKDTAVIRGMIDKVRHLVSVQEA